MRLSVLPALLLAVTTAACSGNPESPTTPSPTPTPTTSAVSYTVLGASDGIGFGSSVVCAPLDVGCENGTGYAQTLRRRLLAEGRTVGYLNLSIPGYVLSAGIVDVARRSGRSDTPGAFLDRYPPFVPTNTTVATIFVGGNDANIIGNAVAAGLGGADPRGFIDAQVRQWGTDLVEFVSRIRARAPNARLVAYNLPNLAAAPYLAGRSTVEKSIMQRIATGLADQVNALTTRNVLVVDLMCDARIIQGSSYSGDGFHPSDLGYALMAELAYPAVANGVASPPQPSCAPRTIFPQY